MPSLPILNERGGLDEFALLATQTIMYYPVNEEKRDRFTRAWQKKVLIELGRDAKEWPAGFSRDLFDILADDPFSDDYWKREFRNIRRRGFVSGHWLHHMVIVNLYHPEHAGNLKWQYLMSEYVLKKHNEENADDRWPISDQSVVTFRNDFLAVAHLWAALRVFEDAGMLEQVCGPEGVPYFLALSEAFRGAARELRLYDELKCGFRAEDAWAAPPELTLPTVRIGIVPLHEEALQCLSGYVSPPTKRAKMRRAADGSSKK